MRPTECPVLPARTPIDGGLRVLAPAKLNLDLRVLGRRADGFHELDSIVARISLYDVIELRPRDDGRIRLECPGLPGLAPEKNLAWRAAERLAARAGGARGVDIALTKHIPAGSGLGGGSSDAAAVLAAMNDLWGLHLPAPELAEIAAGLGSDVPLFLGPPAARIRGRGEIVEPAAVHPFVALLVLPEIHCPTPEVYAAWDAAAAPRGSPPARPRMTALPSVWREGLVNDLAAAARTVRPELGELMDLLAAEMGLPVQLTGSGSGLFVLFDSLAVARTSAGLIPDELADRTYVVHQNAW